MEKKIKNKAFTLVELIVTITILAILGIIGFMSFQNYTVYARDVTRITDLSNIKGVLELNYTRTSKFPVPDDVTEIKYDGTTVWNQGTFGKKTRRKTKNLDSVPVDPLFGNEYTLSVSENGQEYEIAAAYEGDEVALSPHLTSPKGQGELSERQERDALGLRGIIGNGAYADSQNLHTRLTGNYNGKVKLISHNGDDYVLALPSLVAIDLSDTSDDNLVNIISAKKLTYNGYNSLPASYGNQEPPAEGAFDFLPRDISNIVVWSGSLSNMRKTGEGFEKLSAGMYKAYLGTNLYLKGDEYKYINSSDVVKYILKAPIEEGTIYRSCKEIKDKKPDETRNGCYDIKGNYKTGSGCLDTGNTEEQYYCDMQKDGGGWTMYVKIKGDYTFNNAKNCIYGERINTDKLYCRVPFAFGKNKELWYQDLEDNESYIISINEQFNENGSKRGSFYNSTYFDLINDKNDTETILYLRLGLNFMHNHSICGSGRVPGGFRHIPNIGSDISDDYMSSSSLVNCYKKLDGDKHSRYENVRQGEFYVR